MLAETDLHLQIGERSQVPDARRQVERLGARLGLGPELRSRAALAVTELGSNLVKHAGPRGGHLFIRGLSAPAGLELLAVDSGPGMADVAVSLEDGFSTAGSAGEGLGAVRRSSQAFDLWSLPGAGAAVVAQFWEEPAASGSSPALGAVTLPKPGEELNGDAWALRGRGGRWSLLVVDGLGHGADAHQAAVAAVAAFEATPGAPPLEALHAVHQALAGTRGATAAVVELDQEARSLRHCAVGNIETVVLDSGGGSRHLAGRNGTAGHQIRTLEENREPLLPGSLLVVHSDGLGSRWRLEAYPGLRPRHPALVAGLLHRDFSRGYDDVTVVALKVEVAA